MTSFSPKIINLICLQAITRNFHTVILVAVSVIYMFIRDNISLRRLNTVSLSYRVTFSARTIVEHALLGLREQCESTYAPINVNPVGGGGWGCGQGVGI